MRKALSKRTRFEVFKRDGFRCMYCGQRPPEVVLVIDHVVPVCEGGSDEADNLVSSCYSCNAGKSGVPLSDTAPAFDELAIAEAMQEVAERRFALAAHFSERKALQRDIDDAVESCRAIWDGLVSNAANPEPSWVEHAKARFERGSATAWVRRGLTSDDFREAAEIVNGWWSARGMNSDHIWRCFCRVCWDAIKAQGSN